uniref:40S ribosomal protein S26 n=1 Tax=Oryza nivara TaxID=4536 RepID=A0A0E0GVJ4_ORYNI
MHDGSVKDILDLWDDQGSKFNVVTWKRRNGGRNKHGRGRGHDKAINRFLVRNIVEQAAVLRYARGLCHVLPKLYAKVHHCVSWNAIHAHIVSVRSCENRRNCELPQHFRPSLLLDDHLPEVVLRLLHQLLPVPEFQLCAP